MEGNEHCGYSEIRLQKRSGIKMEKFELGQRVRIVDEGEILAAGITNETARKSLLGKEIVISHDNTHFNYDGIEWIRFNVFNIPASACELVG